METKMAANFKMLKNFLALALLLNLVSSGAFAKTENCSDMDLQKAAVGTTCRNSLGLLFEKVQHGGFGEAWLAPDGLIWSDNLGLANQKVAETRCKNSGGLLPSIEQLAHIRLLKFHEVIPHLEVDSVILWSSNVSENEHFAHVLQLINGFFPLEDRRGLALVRCVY